MVTLIRGNEHTPVSQSDQITLSLDPVIQHARHVPQQVIARSNQGSIHRPVVILAQRNPVSRVVIMAFCKRNQMRRIDDVDVVEHNTDAACRTSVVIRLADGPTERGVSRAFPHPRQSLPVIVNARLHGFLIDSNLLFIFRNGKNLVSVTWEIAVNYRVPELPAAVLIV
jgi:hypothetical protein